jgi:hypothetical protein
MFLNNKIFSTFIKFGSLPHDIFLTKNNAISKWNTILRLRIKSGRLMRKISICNIFKQKIFLVIFSYIFNNLPYIPLENLYFRKMTNLKNPYS